MGTSVSEKLSQAIAAMINCSCFVMRRRDIDITPLRIFDIHGHVAITTPGEKLWLCRLCDLCYQKEAK
jgi:hypothetical protein